MINLKGVEKNSVNTTNNNKESPIVFDYDKFNF